MMNSTGGPAGAEPDGQADAVAGDGGEEACSPNPFRKRRFRRFQSDAPPSGRYQIQRGARRHE